MYYNVGKIVNTHGIRGELKVVSTTDFPEERFKKGSQLAVFKNNNDQTPFQTVTLTAARNHKGFTLLTFDGYDDINTVLPFKGMVLKVADNQLTENDLDEGEYYYHQIIGLTVVDLEGQVIGTVKEIMAPGANDVWVVERFDKSELLLPVIKQVVRQVDLVNRRVEVDLMEGLD